MRPVRIAACSLAVLLAGSCASGQDAAELELDHTLSMDFETPHVKWAKPYAGGTIRVLLFCNGRGTVAREGVELMQRFDMQIDAVFWRRIVDTTREGWHGGDLGLQRMLRLASKPYDCYVFLGVRPEQLTSEMQVKVLDPVVEGGAGIVLVGVSDKRILKKQRLYDAFNWFMGGTGVRGLYHVGKGRGVLLPKLPAIPYDLGWQSEYESWQERFGRAIVWAAGRKRPIGLAILGPKAGERIAWSDVASRAVGFGVDGPDAGRVTVEASIRLQDGGRIGLPSGRPDGAGFVPRGKFPLLPVGRHHLDAIARGDGGVESWATRSFEVTSERRVGAVKLDSPWGEVGGRIQGTVELLGPPRAGEELDLRVRDRRGRILAQKRDAAREGARLDFPIERWFPMLVCVEAWLLDGGNEKASAHEWFHVVKRHRGQFNFLIWDTPGGATAPYAEESLARLGTTLQLRGGAPPRYVAACDIAWVPYTTRILESHDEQGIMRPSCWNDEGAVLARVRDLAEKYRPARQHGVFVYSLGDENQVRGSCTSALCLKAYRQYLMLVYGTVDKLNASWGSSYKSFAEAQLLQPDDNQANEAKRRKNYPRWYDRQAFRSWNYVQYCKRFAAAYRAIDPRSRTGFEGAGRFGACDDIDLFVREGEFWSPYPGTADEVLRSIAPRDFPRSNWMGYRKDATSLIAKYWRMVTRGCDSVWWWRWDGIGRFHGFLAPHLGPWPATKALVDETQIVRDGLGDLLLRSEMLDDGIAMLFSHPSLYANKVEGSSAYGSVEQNHQAWHRAIRELGLQFRYVTDRQLRLGEFDATRDKVLVLSQCEAIGAKEAMAIAEFVRNGGHVIADVRPGIYDGHCKPLEKGCLDDLFGIRRAGRGAPAKGRAESRLEGIELAFDSALCDPGVEPAGTKAYGKCGEHPLMIVNDAGKGSALLLNCSMTSYPSLQKPGAPDEGAKLLAELFRIAGIKPPVATRTKGRRTRNLETVRWRNGAIEIVALFRHTGEDEDVQVELAGPRHVRDLRFRRSFEDVQVFPTKILGSRPTWLVLSSKPLASVKATLSKPKAARGTQPTLRFQVPGAQGLHAIRLRATTPGGTPADWLHQVVLVGADPVDVPLPIALNDPKGQWTLRAIDLFTDRAESLTLTAE